MWELNHDTSITLSHKKEEKKEQIRAHNWHGFDTERGVVGQISIKRFLVGISWLDSIP